jgi:hypothetical protein
VNKEIGDPSADVYTIIPPIADRPYCQILSFDIVDIVYEDENGDP